VRVERNDLVVRLNVNLQYSNKRGCERLNGAILLFLYMKRGRIVKDGDRARHFQQGAPQGGRAGQLSVHASKRVGWVERMERGLNR
jgi:hypothetical protein